MHNCHCHIKKVNIELKFKDSTDLVDSIPALVLEKGFIGLGQTTWELLTTQGRFNRYGSMDCIKILPSLERACPATEGGEAGLEGKSDITPCNLFLRFSEPSNRRETHKRAGHADRQRKERRAQHRGDRPRRERHNLSFFGMRME